MLTLSGCKNIMIISEVQLYSIQQLNMFDFGKLGFLLLLPLIKIFPIGKYRKRPKCSSTVRKPSNCVLWHALNTVSLKILESICMSEIKPTMYVLNSYTTVTGSRSTFEFPSRVNLSGPSLYCT